MKTMSRYPAHATKPLVRHRLSQMIDELIRTDARDEHYEKRQHQLEVDLKATHEAWLVAKASGNETAVNEAHKARTILQSLIMHGCTGQK